MMQSASYGFLLIFTYLHQALLGLAEFTALFQNFRVFIPVIRELFLSNASSDAGRHPRFPGYPLAFLPSCESVHSLGRKARNQLCITAAFSCDNSLSHDFLPEIIPHFSQTVSIIPSKTLSIFFHIQRNLLAFLFIFLNFFHFHDMKPLYPDIGVWTDATVKKDFFRCSRHRTFPLLHKMYLVTNLADMHQLMAD